ncbi:hypothetical protein EK21DRAFT_101964 [Setomelanomma holmii]|uniref:DUF8035 domain-containing protein n=1 Tax=Setomelanomma holmii TaxID=210430 RepID=A0A9P4H793_9PLEO|nr:hypothetical protein EK21DRAFT_101964 [Setomelanomma holmii]
MLGSVLLPSRPSGLRSNTYTSGSAPPLPPRRNSLSTAPAAQTAKLQLKISTLPNTDTTMDSRYKRSSSPRRYANPGRSSTGTFADPSPRTSAERIGGSLHPSTYYVPSSSGSRGTGGTTSTVSSSYGRPRRNTGEAMTRPTAPSTSMPIRTPYTPHGHLDRPSSPLAKSWDKRGDTYITQGPTRTQHKKIYSVDDTSHSTQLVAERELELARSHRDSIDRGYGGVTSGGRTYHNSSKPPARLTDLGDDGYSYTDPASMYRDTEPAWRRPRAGSLERTSRPSSMIVDRPARSSARELGPPPSVRGFDKINKNIPRSHGRSSSIDRSREIPKYDLYPDETPSRSSSTRQHAPAIHQEPRDHRRDTYHDPYDRRDRENENRRHNTVDHLPDREVSTRGFGIAPANPALAHDHHALDREPIWKPQDTALPRPDEYGSQYHSSHRADARMPDPRSSRDRDLAPPPPPPQAAAAAAYDNYDKRPREREPRERENSSSYVPAVAGAATGVAATLGAAGYMKSRDREKDRESSEERERERERERRRAYDALDSRDKEDRRDRRSDDRDDKRERRPDERRDVPPPAPAYAPPPEADRKPRERRYEDDDKERSSRKAPSSEGSGDERPRHYVDRDAERRESERRREPAQKEAPLDPDEDYRRRVQAEAERSSRAARDRDQGDSDRERERRPRKDEADRSRVPEERSRASPPTAREPPSSRYDERSSSVYDANLVQEPESFDKLQSDQPSKSVTIVAPPKEAAPPVKGILRKPTEKFPEEPEPIREGVAPHKDALKGKDIPIGARWTRIDRRLVNPEALEEAKERFEERMDCVIVLRVLTKQEIQKLADRTKRLREKRGKFSGKSCEEYDDRDDRDRGDRDKRSSHHGSRDDRDDEDRDRGRDRDRERRRRYDDDDASEYDDLGRERERERDRPKMLEPAR